MPTIVFHGLQPGEDIDLMLKIEQRITDAPYRERVTYANTPATLGGDRYLEVRSATSPDFEDLSRRVEILKLRVEKGPDIR